MKILRTRMRRLCKGLVPLLALAYLSAFAVPCVGMVTHDMSPEQAEHEMHQAHAAGMAHEQTGSRDDSCPHCIGGEHSEQSSGAHISCDASESYTDTQRAKTPLNWDAKFLASALTTIFDTADLHGPPIHSAHVSPDSPVPQRALNLRYCVFLI